MRKKIKPVTDLNQPTKTIVDRAIGENTKPEISKNPDASFAKNREKIAAKSSKKG